MTYLKLGISLIIAFAVGGLCSVFDIPLPAPPTLEGAALVLTITSGYLIGQNIRHRFLNSKEAP